MTNDVTLPGRIILRRAGPDSATVMAALVNAHSRYLVGTRRALVDGDGDLRLARYVPAAAEQYLGHISYAAPGALFHLISRPPHVVVELGCTLLSGFVRAAPLALAWLEERARELAQPAPDGARVVWQCTQLADDTAGIQVLEQHGFRLAREWVHFELALEEPPAVALPEGVTIRLMDPRTDWPAVGAAMDEAFADHWGEMGPEARTLLEEDEPVDEATDEMDDAEPEDDPYSNSLGLCFVAEADGQVIGSCLCNARTIEWADSGKIGSLSVRRAWRGRGVGAALTATALDEFHRRGIRRVITDTDSDGFTGAYRLYRRFGFTPYRYEYVYEKEIRPGWEWRMMTPEEMDR
ncbi:GNAT family N-acetyltransferase [Promineifilum sp.]|uniref:GNAT family N-acetyltransferase n=1 Tax=Promineifilum sp. TaxID=2664178 RepID=UPI0035AF7AC4